MNLYELERELANYYQFQYFEDYCHNGIQVEGKEEVNKVVLSVNINIDVIEFAIKEKADAIIVHHGFFGKSFLSIRGNLRDRVKKLLENDISLIGIHLPMDANYEIGHNRIISNIIELTNLEPFNYGLIGQNEKGFGIVQIMQKIENYLSDRAGIKKGSIKIYNYLNDIPKKVAVISGESYKYFEEAIERNVDLFISGSIAQHIPQIALEEGKAILSIGHYNSEVMGIIALSHLLKERYGLNTKLIFNENDL